MPLDSQVNKIFASLSEDGILEDVLNKTSEVAEKQKHKEIIEYVVKLLYEYEIEPLQDELIALENRSCESCKYYHQGYLCLEIGSGNFCPSKDFCCNKYETKAK